MILVEIAAPAYKDYSCKLFETDALIQLVQLKRLIGATGIPSERVA
jgi:hypothetical protein